MAHPVFGSVFGPVFGPVFRPVSGSGHPHRSTSFNNGSSLRRDGGLNLDAMETQSSCVAKAEIKEKERKYVLLNPAFWGNLSSAVDPSRLGISAQCFTGEPTPDSSAGKGAAADTSGDLETCQPLKSMSTRSDRNHLTQSIGLTKGRESCLVVIGSSC
jgi:hypothetical protein